MKRIRVLVVDDSLTVRRWLCEVLERDPELEVVGEASDGKRAIELCGKLRPDVITLDMMMPVMTGVATTEYIMAHFPTPILIVSSSFNRGELFRTYDALSAGAVDVLEKPRAEEPSADWEARFLSTVKLVSRIRVITHPRGRLRPTFVPAAAPSTGIRQPAIVAIGASTGGPSAIVDILRALPEHYPVPVVIVLHLSALFSSALAEWLDAQSVHDVRFASDQDELVAGRVLLAPADRHVVVDGARVRLTDEPARHSCRPSVDVLFESLARGDASRVVACLLTGMGRDGAAGLLAIRRAGGHTIAQDEESSVVYGMPREARELDAASQILSLTDIASHLAAYGRRGGGGA